MINTQIYYVSHEVIEEIYIQRHDFIVEGLASCYEQINEGPEEFKLVEVERDKQMAWQLDVSLETVLGMACKALQKSEELLKISESENSGPDSKTVAMTELGDAFVKRRSPVQVRASA